MIACVKTWTYPPVRPWANHLISQFPRVSVCMCVHVHMSMHSVMFDSLGSLCDPMDCPPGSSVHGISQARILEWVAISYSRGSSQPRD